MCFQLWAIFLLSSFHFFVFSFFASFLVSFFFLYRPVHMTWELFKVQYGLALSWRKKMWIRKFVSSGFCCYFFVQIRLCLALCSPMRLFQIFFFVFGFKLLLFCSSSSSSSQIRCPFLIPSSCLLYSASGLLQGLDKPDWVNSRTVPAVWMHP